MRKVTVTGKEATALFTLISRDPEGHLARELDHCHLFISDTVELSPEITHLPKKVTFLKDFIGERAEFLREFDAVVYRDTFLTNSNARFGKSVWFGGNLHAGGMPNIGEFDHWVGGHGHFTKSAVTQFGKNSHFKTLIANATSRLESFEGEVVETAHITHSNLWAIINARIGKNLHAENNPYLKLVDAEIGGKFHFDHSPVPEEDIARLQKNRELQKSNRNLSRISVAERLGIRVNAPLGPGYNQEEKEFSFIL